MVVSIQGRRLYLWRAVDSQDEILDLLVQAEARQSSDPQAHAEAAPKAGLWSEELNTHNPGVCARSEVMIPSSSCPPWLRDDLGAF